MSTIKSTNNSDQAEFAHENAPMKLAMLGDSFLLDPTTGVNGTQVQNYNLARAFVAAGLEVHYIAMTMDSERPQREKEEGMIIHWLRPAPRPFGYLGEYKRVLRVLDEIRPGALYNRGRSVLTYASADWARRHGARMVWGSNGEDSCDLWKRITRLKRSDRAFWRKAFLLPHEFVLDLMIHRGIRRAHMVVNQTNYQLERLKKVYGKSGIVLPSFFPPSFTPAAHKQKYILWLANLSDIKRPEVFIRLAAAMNDVEGWAFVMAGGAEDSAYRNRVLQLAVAAPQLEILGKVSYFEAEDLIAGASLIVSTSRWEGVSNVMVQGWLCGTPVAVLEHDPNAWIMSNDLGYCASGDLKQLENWIRHLLADEAERRRIGRRCKEFAAGKFSSTQTIESYLRIFEGELGHETTL